MRVIRVKTTPVGAEPQRIYVAKASDKDGTAVLVTTDGAFIQVKGISSLFIVKHSPLRRELFTVTTEVVSFIGDTDTSVTAAEVAQAESYAD